MSNSSGKYRQRPQAAHWIAQQSDAELGGLLRKARQYQHLDQLFTGMVDPDLAASCRVACLHGNALVLLATTPAWATRLKMLSPDLLCRFRQSGHPEIKSITVKVSPPSISQALPPRPKRLSNAARTALARFAETCSDDELKLVARKFSRREAGD